ncbi:HD-GYP domain-containing protein [Paenibacillus sp. MBLB4367]|uniref:HD-GYP domain-containing protein n=1 Tax=Paenibacillus sp. MBLB4367 TaxID=3384767 RepID=UPI0039082A3E
MNLNDLIGYRLTKDIYNRFGLIVIPEQTILCEDHFELLGKHGVSLSELEVTEPDRMLADNSSDSLTKSERKLQQNERLISGATEEMKHLFETVLHEKKIPLQEINDRLLPTIDSAASNVNLHHLLSGLQAKDDYTYRHNIGVSVLSNMLGKWLLLPPAELDQLTTAALLHDVGKINVANDILNKPGKYTDAEYERMKKHTIYGYEIIRGMSDLSPRIALAALQHHEREDGKGYPYGISGKEMDYFSKIVAVADVFHAMTSSRVYREASPFYQVIMQMQQDGFGKLDTAICSVFVRRMMELAVGSEVILTDGRRGKVVLIHAQDPGRPLVQIGSHYIDLSKNRQLQVQSIAG